MPAVVLAWVPKQLQVLSISYTRAPLYSDPQRGNVIADLQLPIADENARQHCVLAGLGACLLA